MTRAGGKFRFILEQGHTASAASAFRPERGIDPWAKWELPLSRVEVREAAGV